MMDEEAADTVFVSTTDSEPGISGNVTVIKPKKTAASTKKKADKELAPAPSKKAKREVGAAKKADKDSAASKKEGKIAEPAKKADKEATDELIPTDKKSFLYLVCEAIEVLGDKRKGLSAQAIKKYVKSKQTSELAGFNSYVNKALQKGIEKGMLERPPASKDSTGAIGSFRLANVGPPKRIIKAARKKTDSEHASDSEATEKPVKPRKRNLSDTYIEEMRASTPKRPGKETTALKLKKLTKKVVKKIDNDKKDTSDSKNVVKMTKRKSTKSESSDTEVDFKKTAKRAPKAVSDKPKAASAKSVSEKSKAASDKPKAAKANSPTKVPKGVKKLYNSKEEKGTKTVRPKRQA